MSASTWLKLQAAIRETRPDLETDFNSCRDRESIVQFMNKNFPLKGVVAEGSEDWDQQILVRIPLILTENIDKVEWQKPVPVDINLPPPPVDPVPVQSIIEAKDGVTEPAQSNSPAGSVSDQDLPQ